MDNKHNREILVKEEQYKDEDNNVFIIRLLINTGGDNIIRFIVNDRLADEQIYSKEECVEGKALIIYDNIIKDTREIFGVKNA